MPFLILREGSSEQVFPIRRPRTSIGRNLDQDIVLPNEQASISRKHAEIVEHEEEFHLVDLGSRNGSRINGKRVVASKRHQLSDGDLVELGEVRLWYLEDEPGQQHTPEVVQALHPTALLDQTGRMTDLRGLSPADQRLTLLLQLGEVIRQSTDVGALMEHFAGMVFSAMDPERVYIGIYDRDLEQWKHEVSIVDRGRSRREFHRSATVTDRVIEEGRAFIFGEGRDGASHASPTQSIIKARIRSAMCCPIPDLGVTLGLLYVDDRQRSCAYEENDLKFLTFLGIIGGAIINNALRHDLVVRRTEALESKASDLVFGRTEPMKELQRQVLSVAPTSLPILLLGETGTGKTVMAREIHRQSPRSEGPFVAVNCAAIPDTLIEAELFGYAPRSGIANADPKGKKGRFELADGGTLFLDEIGDMPMAQQSKILDVIETKRLYRLGGTREIKVNVRIIAATSQPVGLEAGDEGSLRSDLYYRLSRVTLKVPALRQRRDDIPRLVEYLLNKITQEFPKHHSGVSGEAMQILCQYDWPGNIRELENYLTQALIHCPGGGSILPRHLPDRMLSRTRNIRRPRVEISKPDSELSSADRARRDEMLRAIHTTGSLTRAAESMGITKQWAIKLAKRYGVKVSHPRSSNSA